MKIILSLAIFGLGLFAHAGMLESQVAPIAHGAAAEPGLLGEYFDLGVWTEDFPKLDGKKPVIKRADKMINFRSSGPAFPETKLTNQFAIRWTGTIKIPKDGNYRFFLESDDGSRLIMDGKTVVDNGGLHEMQEQSDATELKAGEHKVEIDYFENENDGGAGCVLSWKAAGLSKEVVPASAFSH
jgi:hypothetical protein